MIAAGIEIAGLELQERLGAGAQGAVFRARRGQENYAVKLPLDTPGDPALTSWFQREALALARVRHPALPEVLEVGAAGDWPYIVMELAPGEPLSKRLRSERRLEPDEIIRLATTLASALDAIHRGGLVHRDVKPGNIVVDVESGAVRLVDFGFAIPMDATRAGTHAAGTRHYIAPEQLDGLGRVDGRADLYSLGCVLYECLHGTPPDSKGAEGRRRKTESSSPLGDIIARLLAHNPDERPPSARALLDELSALGSAADGGGALGDETAVQRRAELPLLGRDPELDRLRRLLDEARARRRPMAVVKGPAGSGKSRLVTELLHEARGRGLRVLDVNARPSDAPFAAIRQLIECQLDAIERLPVADRLREIAALREGARDVAPLLRLLGPRIAALFPDAPPVPRSDDAEHIAAEAIAAYCADLLRSFGPSVLCIDDAQWLDSGSRRVIVKLVDRLADDPILPVIAVRTGDQERALDRLMQLDGRTPAVLELAPLKAADIVLLARAHLGGARLDPELQQAVLGLSDGTPLGVIELLRAMLDAGVCAPHWGRWQLDVDALAAMQLPRGSAALLSQRVERLDQTTRSVLTAGAILGLGFEDHLVASICEIAAPQVHSALAVARQAQLVTAAANGRHEFVHAAAREALLDALAPEVRRKLNQAAAKALEDDLASESAEREGIESPVQSLVLLDGAVGSGGGEVDAQRWYAVATHYSAGEIEEDPSRVYSACLRAARLAFRSFDNERALSFFATAERAAAMLPAELPPEIEFLIGEAHLRAGQPQDCLERFERVITASEDPPLRALAFCRMAWVQMQFDEDAAWGCLTSGFHALGAVAPDDTWLGLLRSLGRWLIGRVLPRRRAVDAAERRRLDALAALHYLSCRLAVQGSHPLRMLQTTLRSVAPAEQLGPSAALARLYFCYSFLLTALNFRKRGRWYLEQAERIAIETQDPVAYSHALSLRYTVAAWAGDIADSVRAAQQCLEEYGQWRELAEFCVIADGIQQILCLQGRNLDAWQWLERAIRKVAQHERALVTLEALEASAHATLVSLGRDDESDNVLALLRARTMKSPRKAIFGLPVHGARVRQFTESMQLGEDFERLVAEVRAREDPRRVHLGATDFYVHVAHARVHALLRAPEQDRSENRSKLEQALSDLRRASRVPLLRAHCAVIEAHAAFFDRDFARAEKLFDRAESLGRRENAPWVIYAVHRGRAHLLRAEGNQEAARDQARLAEAIAREHGAAHRVRFVREEFGLAPLARVEPGRSSLSLSWSREPSSNQTVIRARGYLRALRRIAQANAMELAPAVQSRMVLDELVQALRAGRGLLLLSPFDQDHPDAPPVATAQTLEVAAARDANGEDLSQVEFDRQLVDDALTAGVVMIGERAVGDRPRGSIVAPLSVHGTTVGAVCLERPLARAGFSEADADVLAALAAQVPVALELARLLYMRERAAENLRTAQKMQAVARLAGGVAHDVNNWMQLIKLSTEVLLAQVEEAQAKDDLRAILDIVGRARALTEQLLAFARGMTDAPPETIDVKGEISRMQAVLTKLLGKRARLALELAPDVGNIRLAPAELSRVITNLVNNARDAIEDDAGGWVRVKAENARIERDDDSGIPAGDYVLLSVSDSGVGMSEDVKARALEPYFTTKQRGKGVGMGLAIVYGVVTQQGGYMQIESEPGEGTTFRLWFPRSYERALPRRAPAVRAELAAVRGKVLVVDDEEPSLQATCRMLAMSGYQTLSASRADEALAIARAHGDEIAVLLTDVQMPDMDGIALAQEITRVLPSLPIVFMSGGSDERLRGYGFDPDVDCLTKPLRAEVLDRALREAVANSRSANVAE